MSILVDVSADGVRSPISVARAREAVAAVLRAERAGNAMVSVAFVTRRRIAALNRKHIGHSGPTDVISFGLTRGRGDPVIGDIYIAPEIAGDNARARGVGVREEMVRVLVHGTLHVLGHDHPEGDDAVRARSAMWRRQERLVRRLMSPRRAR
jgi:probable rRNA maturation factor